MPRLLGLAVTVWAHFSLTYVELERYMGMAREQVALVEASQRPFSLAAEGLLVLLLPPELRDLKHRENNLDYFREDNTDNSTGIQNKLARFTAEIGVQKSIISSLIKVTKA